MADFSTIDSNSQNIPYSQSTIDSALALTNPDNILSGQMRGGQNAYQLKVVNPNDGSTIGMGVIPGSTTNEFGFFCLDANGNLIMKIVNGTWYVYDVINNKNVMQSGKLPNSTYGWSVATTGYNVADIYT